MRLLALLLTLALAASATAQPLDIEGPAPFRPEGRPLEGLVITVDAGHGGSSTTDEGVYAGSARGTESRVVEGDLNMNVASLLRHHLRRAGATVHMTRYDDRRVTLGDTDRATELGARTAVAEETRSHLFLSLHHNATSRDSADGVVILIWPTDGEGNEQPLEIAFADALREEVQSLVPHSEEFPHYVHLHPLVASRELPSAVVEFGFLTNEDFDTWVSQQGAHNAEALGVYNGVVRFWQEHREGTEALRDRIYPDTRTTQDGNDFRRRARPRMARVADSLWPLERAPETPEEAEHIINLYRMTVISDRTFFHLDAEVEGGPGDWRVTGTSNHPIVREAVGELLEAAGCDPIRNEIRMLPSAALGEERYGVVQIPMALTYDVPRIGGLPATQLLLGERVWLLDVSEDGDFLLHMAGDGYVGWVRRDAIRRLGAQEFAHWQMAWRAVAMRDILVDDLRVPAGAALPILEVGRRTVTCGLPMGVRATEGAEEVELPLRDVRLSDSEAKGREIALTASEFMTAPYVFGGRSGIGLDCSGLSGIAYQAHGLRLPRDARQQILVGELVATPWHLGPLRAGDLIFFLDSTGRVSHEAVSLGGMRFVHSATPQVHVASLDPDDPLYSENYAGRLGFARRPLE